MNTVHSAASVSEIQIRYPLILPQSPWRRALKVLLGRALLKMRPEHGRKLLQQGDPMKFSLIDRFMVAGLVGSAKTEQDWLALNQIHQRFWAGEGGAIFNAAPEVADRFNTWFLGKHERSFECLRRELAATSHDCPAICEIGSGNGLALKYISEKFPGIPRLIGIDINVHATRQNQERWAGTPRLEFVAGDAVEWITQNAGAGWIYFSNAGVMEYFPQQKVSALYRHTASLGTANAWWVLTEPVGAHHDLNSQPDSQVHGKEFSFSHNHPHLLRQAGWEVIEQYETEVAGIRWLTLCARRSPSAFV